MCNIKRSLCSCVHCDLGLLCVLCDLVVVSVLSDLSSRWSVWSWCFWWSLCCSRPRKITYSTAWVTNRFSVIFCLQLFILKLIFSTHIVVLLHAWQSGHGETAYISNEATTEGVILGLGAVTAGLSAASRNIDSSVISLIVILRLSRPLGHNESVLLRECNFSLRWTRLDWTLYKSTAGASLHPDWNSKSAFKHCGSSFSARQ